MSDLQGRRGGSVPTQVVHWGESLGATTALLVLFSGPSCFNSQERELWRTSRKRRRAFRWRRQRAPCMQKRAGAAYKLNSEHATVHLALKKISVLGLSEPVCAFGSVCPSFPSVRAVRPIHVLVRVMRSFGLCDCGSSDLAFLLFSFRSERVTLGYMASPFRFPPRTWPRRWVT